MFETSLWIEFEGNGDAFSFCSERKRVKFVEWKLNVGKKKKLRAVPQWRLPCQCLAAIGRLNIQTVYLWHR